MPAHFLIKPSLIALVGSICLISLTTLHSASAATSEWAEAYGGKMRLVTGGMISQDHKAGLEVQLDAGWKTYWKVPGDSGIPPSLDFSQSSNVKSVKVLWPAPTRYGDDKSALLGYKDWIIFPLQVTPKDTSKPVKLKLDANLGLCSDLCVPVNAMMEIAIPAQGEKDLASETMIDRDLAIVPEQSRDGFQITALKQEKRAGKPDLLTISATIPAGMGVKDLFVEGPEGWFLPLTQRVNAEMATFSLELDGLPKNAKTKGKPLKFTLTNGDEAVEQIWVLEK